VTDHDRIPTVAEAKIWQPSGLIESARVPDQSLLQTEEFDRENPGELEVHELVRASDIIQLIEDIRDERTLPDTFESNTGAENWNTTVNKILNRIKSEIQSQEVDA
jgi:hypothetical protein